MDTSAKGGILRASRSPLYRLVNYVLREFLGTGLVQSPMLLHIMGLARYIILLH